MFGVRRASRERSRHERRARAGIKQLRSGTVVQLQGIPLTLVNDTDAQTNPANWSLIQFDAGADRDTLLATVLCWIVVMLAITAWFAFVISAGRDIRPPNDGQPQQHFAP